MTIDTQVSALTFHETTFDLVAHETGEPWLRVGQIAPALGYKDQRSLNALYAANAAEFTDRMTALVKLPTAGGMQEVRIFSLRGAHLLGMFARTARAAEFRRWVLDVLDDQAAPPAGPALPPPVATATVLATFERVVAERDALRSMLAERVLKEKPRLRKVMYYYAIQGLTHQERAVLMGWKTTNEWFKDLKELAALGLVDYQPNPDYAARGRKMQADYRQRLEQEGRSRGKRDLSAIRPRPDRKGQTAEVLQRARDERSNHGAAKPHADADSQVVGTAGRKSPNTTNGEQQS